MRKILKGLIERIPPNFIERALALSLLKNKFSSVRKTKSFETREQLWEHLFAKFSSEKIMLLEFGVFEGYSIKKFAELNSNNDSSFIGFDSFEGLPEDWTATRKKGAFNVNGSLPYVSDSRVSFVKGWFQNTLPDFLQKLDSLENLIVHYDADIYSATLYVLLQLDAMKFPYYAIFDEFTNHETRALFSYIQLTGAEVEFFGKCGDSDYPMQVSCKINPNLIYAPK
jgi:hypothetical protein